VHFRDSRFVETTGRIFPTFLRVFLHFFRVFPHFLHFFPRFPAFSTFFRIFSVHRSSDKMALILGSSIVRGSLFELPDHEAAFHPWWDAMRDYIVYTAIVVGKPPFYNIRFEIHRHFYRCISFPSFV
jgi:hypothetical protein